MASLLLLTIPFSTHSTANGLSLDEIGLIQKTDTEALKQGMAQILCGQEPLIPVLEIQLQHPQGLDIINTKEFRLRH